MKWEDWSGLIGVLMFFGAVALFVWGMWFISYNYNKSFLQPVCVNEGYNQLTDYKFGEGSGYRIECDGVIIKQKVLCFDKQEVDKWGEFVKIPGKDCHLWRG